MRNETLKNLLLTASLISASALITACGDEAKKAPETPATPATENPILDQAEKKVADALDKVDLEQKQVQEAENEAFRTIQDAQKAAGEEVKGIANQTAMDFANFDAQLPAKVEKASADAMVKAKMAYLEFESKVIPQSTLEVTAKLESISFPKVEFKSENLANLRKQLDLANTALANTAEISLDDQREKLMNVLADRVKARDAYIKEVKAYYSPANYAKDADIEKREEIIESLLTSFESSQQKLAEKLQRIQGYLSSSEKMYNSQRQKLTDSGVFTLDIFIL